MKNFIITIVLMVISAGTIAAQNNNFNPKLKQFVILLNDTYVPEISIDQAIMLGFSINDYNNFIKHLDSLNSTKTKPVYLYENNFLEFFIKYEKGKLVLDISLQQALKAGATIQGYQANRQMVEEYNRNLSPKEMQEIINYVKTVEIEAINYIKSNPEKTINDYIDKRRKEETERFNNATRYKFKK